MINYELDPAAMIAACQRVHGLLESNVPQALQLSADLVAAEAKQNHNYVDRSTNLTNSIDKDEVQGTFRSGLSITVSAGAWYGVIIELGTKKKNYPIVPRFRKWLRFPNAGGFAFSKGVIHPGITGRKFLANALEAKEPKIQGVLNDATELSFAQAGFQVHR